MSLAFPKPAKGSSAIDRKARRKQIEQYEDQQKLIVRKRDRICRWPYCRHMKDQAVRLEVAHVEAKKIGGDHGVRSHSGNLMLLCFWHHQADAQPGHPEGSIERHDLKIEPLTAEGTNGPCSFYAKDADGRWFVVRQETAPFLYARD